MSDSKRDFNDIFGIHNNYHSPIIPNNLIAMGWLLISKMPPAKYATESTLSMAVEYLRNHFGQGG